MPVVRRSRASRSAVLAGAVLVLTGLVVTGPPAARADDGDVAAGATVVGTLVQAWPEYREQAEAVARADEGPLSWIETRNGTSVRVPTDDLAASADVAAAGDTVAVTVGREVVDTAAAADGLDPARTVLDAAVLAPAAAATPPATVPGATGITDPVTVVMVVPRGGRRDGRTLQQVVDAVDGPVAAFWRGQSDGRVRVGVTASYGWRPAAHDCSDATGLWNEVATSVRWTRGPGKHLLLYLPTTSTDCAYGLAEVGSALSSGGRLYVRDTATSVIAHELGHNLGLGHSSELQCTGTVEGSGCAAAAYSDWYDVMGYSWGPVGTLNVAQADRLGLLPAAERVARATSAPAGRYTLVPVSAARGTRAVELTAPFGRHYWLEYRQASGQDAWLGTRANLAGLDSGVTLRRSDVGPVTGSRPDSSLLLDGTPSRSSGWAADRRVAFPVGRAVPVQGGDFTVTVQSVTAAGAVVVVSPGTSPIGAKYVASGGAGGVLGAAVRAQVCGLRDGGCYRRYAGGSIYWSPSTPAAVVRGAIRDRWAALGYERGALGYPVADAGCGLRGGGCAQRFQHGAVYWSPASGAHPVTGALLTAWKARGAERGALGYPVADPRTSGRTTVQRFQHGTLSYASGAVRAS